MVDGRGLCNPPHRFEIFNTFPEWCRRWMVMNGRAGVVPTSTVVCLAFEVIMKDHVEQLHKLGVAATARGIDDRRSREVQEFEGARLCVNMVCNVCFRYTDLSLCLFWHLCDLQCLYFVSAHFLSTQLVSTVALTCLEGGGFDPLWCFNGWGIWPSKLAT